MTTQATRTDQPDTLGEAFAESRKDKTSVSKRPKRSGRPGRFILLLAATIALMEVVARTHYQIGWKGDERFDAYPSGWALTLLVFGLALAGLAVMAAFKVHKLNDNNRGKRDFWAMTLVVLVALLIVGGFVFSGRLDFVQLAGIILVAAVYGAIAWFATSVSAPAEN